MIRRVPLWPGTSAEIFRAGRQHIFQTHRQKRPERNIVIVRAVIRNKLFHIDTGNPILRRQLRPPAGTVGDVGRCAIGQRALEPLHIAGRLKAVQIEAVLADGDDIIKFAGVGNIHTGEHILAQDAAALAHTQQRAGIAQVGFLETGYILAG